MSKFTQQRNAELYRKIKELYGNSSSICEAIEKAVNSQASQYYISYEDAYKYVHRKEKGLQPYRGMKMYKKAFESLYNKFKIIKCSFPTLPQREIFTKAYYSPAPSFFLSYTQGLSIYRKERKLQHHRGM